MSRVDIWVINNGDIISCIMDDLSRFSNCIGRSNLLNADADKYPSICLLQRSLLLILEAALTIRRGLSEGDTEILDIC